MTFDTGPSPYFQSLSPEQQQARLALMHQYNPNPGLTDDMIRFMDLGDTNKPGDPTGYLNRPPSQYELALKAQRDQENSRSNWVDVGRPAAIDVGAMVASSGKSLLGKFGGGAESPNVPQTQYAGGNGMPTFGTNMPVAPGSSSGLFDNLLGTVGNLSPAILAGYLGNSQRQDVMGQVGRLNDVAGSLSGPAFMQSITNPYDLQTGQGRTALSQSLQQRGVGGSSFGNQQLGNYDYQRGIGRGDLATRAGTAVAGTQGQLYSDALRGIVGGNAAYNSLLGAGLGASGSLFNRGAGNPLAGLIGGLGGIGNSIGGLFGTGTDTTTNPYPDSNPGGQVDFGNDPSLATSGTSGNGLFDWLGQNGGDVSLGGPWPV